MTTGQTAAVRRAPERQRARQERILQVAMEHFARHGYEDARAEEIAAGAGVSKGTVFGYFETKAGLFLAAYQAAATFAKERLQGRSLTGPKNPNGPADPIIVHPDIRRMLLTQKAFAEGGRVLGYYAATLVDLVERSPDVEERKRADELLSLKVQAPCGDALAALAARLAIS